MCGRVWCVWEGVACGRVWHMVIITPPLLPPLSSFLSTSNHPLPSSPPSPPSLPLLSVPSVYEAMESYAPQNDDEVGFNTGDRIEVLSKSMDGWWKIRSVVRMLVWGGRGGSGEGEVEVGRER